MGLQGVSFPGGPQGGIGGFVGQQARNIGNIGANTGALQQSAQGLTGASQGLIGQAQGMAGTPNLAGAGNLAAGQGLLGNALQSGLAVDVNPLVEAAQIRGQQQFQENLRGVDERMGALGLGASSAAEAARSRESSRMAGGIEALGLEAGVGAAQQAAQNQLAALGLTQGGVGQGLQAQQISQQGQAQGLQGLQGAGQLQGQAANLGLQGQLGQAGAGQGLINPLLPTFNQTMQAPPSQQLPQSPMGGSRMGAVGGTSRGGFQRMQGGGVIGRAGETRGGGRQDLGDYLSQSLFGTTFNRPAFGGQEQFQPMASPQRRQGDPLRQLKQQMELEEEFQRRAESRRQAEAMRQGGIEDVRSARFARGLTGQGLATAQRGSVEDVIGALGVDNAFEGLMQSGRILGQLGASTPSAQVGAMDVLAQGQRPDQFGPGLTRAQMGFQGGGSVPGPSQPPDQVPILAQGGEVVLPLKVADAIRKSKSKDPLVKKIKKLASKKNSGMGFQFGGGIPTQRGNEFLRSQGGGQTFQLGQNIAEPGSGFGPGEFPVINSGQGTLSTLGVEPQQPTPGEMAAQRRADAERRRDLIRSAMVTGSQGTMQRLAPLLQEAEASVVNSAAEEDAIRARAIESERNQVRLQEALISADVQTQGLQARSEQAGVAREDKAKAAETEASEANRKAFLNLMDSIMKSGDNLNPITPEEAFLSALELAPSVGIELPPGAEERGQILAGTVSATKLNNEVSQFKSIDEIDDIKLVGIMQSLAQLNDMGFSEEDIAQEYPALLRAARELAEAGRL